jgi:hypothetical protein
MPRGRPALDSSPPPLPVLEGGVAQLSPLLGAQDSLPDLPAPPSSLRPDEVVEAPALAALPGLRTHQRGLLPNLDDDEADDPPRDPKARRLVVELVLRPPPLPPLPEMAVP